MTAAAKTFNDKPATEKATKFVNTVAIDGANGAITMTLEGLSAGLPTDAQGKKVVFTPNVNKAALAAGVSGAIDWACASATNATATTRGLGGIVAGDLPAKYAPAECR